MLIVVGVMLLLGGMSLATNVNFGGRTDVFIVEIVFIGLGLGCLVYGAICLHDDRQDKKLEQEEEEEEEEE